MNALFNIGIFLSFFLSILLLSKKNKSLPDKILGSWLIFIGFHLFSYFLYLNGYWESHPHLIGATAPFPLLHGPFLFLYTLYTLKGTTKLAKKDYWHTAPFVASYLYMSPFLLFYTAEQKQMVDSGELSSFSIFTIVLMVLVLCSVLLYPFFTWRLIKKYHSLLKQNFSYREHINLNWLKFLILGMAILFATIAFVVIVRELGGFALPINAELIFCSQIILFVLGLGYYGIRHQNVFVNFSEPLNSELLKNEEAGYLKSGLKQDLAQQHHESLLALMQNTKPYLNPKLTLRQLADDLNISTNHLSQVINQYEKVNFHEFVNRYRVSEFIERYKKHEGFSILALALDSGFNSKSAFNSVFKKIHNTTPSQFLERL